MPTATDPRPIRIVQFGEGVFLRACVDWMVHRLNTEAGANLGVALVQPRNSDSVARLMADGGDYHLLLQGVEAGVEHDELVHIDVFEAGVNTHVDPDGFVALATNPDVRVVVSNTTEAGIVFSETDADLGVERRSEVSSYPGKLLWLLVERHRALSGSADGGQNPRLHVLPCELIESNGDTLRGFVARLADAWQLGDEFAAWLESEVVFHNTLVDRIVPGYPADDAARVEQQIGRRDPHLVKGEWYHAWVIDGERDGLLEALPLDRLDLNVNFVDDLTPHRELKVRILNGAHTALTPVAHLAGIDTVREAIEDAEVGAFVQALMREELAPTVPLPAAEVADFVDSVLDRFRNPWMRHEVMSISLNGVSKLKARLLGTLADRWQAGMASPRLAVAVAAFIDFYRGERDGEPFEVKDGPTVLAAFEELHRLYPAGREDQLVRAVVSHPDIFGDGEPWDDAFVNDIATALTRLRSEGIRSVLA